MPQRTPPPGQLDIPLIWEPRREDPAAERPGPAHEPARPASRAGAWRLWLALLADAGVLVLVVASIWGLAAALGAGLGPAQLVLAGLAGLEAASVVAVGCLWGWRGSPGMLLAGVCFSRPIPFARASRVWVILIVSLLVLGLPLLLRRRGDSVAERLAGGTLSFRPSPGDA